MFGFLACVGSFRPGTLRMFVGSRAADHHHCAVVSGESDVTAQLASEQAELIRRGPWRLFPANRSKSKVTARFRR